MLFFLPQQIGKFHVDSSNTIFTLALTFSHKIQFYNDSVFINQALHFMHSALAINFYHIYIIHAPCNKHQLYTGPLNFLCA